MTATGDAAETERTGDADDTSTAPRRRWPRRLPAWCWPALAAALAAQTWFRPGQFWASGDVPPFVRAGLADEVGWLWNHQSVGAGSTSYAVARLVEVWLLDAVTWLGGSETLAQRLFFTVLAAAVAGAVAWCAAAVVRSPWAVAAAGAVAFLNPFWFPRLPNPLVLLVVALLAYVTGVLLRVAAADDSPRPAVLALVSLSASYLALNPPLLAVLAVWTLAVVAAGSLLGGPGGLGRTTRYALRVVPLVLAVNAFWIVPLVITVVRPAGFSIAAETDVRAWSWTHVNNSLANLAQMKADWAWYRQEYVPVAVTLEGAPLRWAMWVLPALAVTAVAVVRGPRARLVRLLGAVAVGLVVLSQGLHRPFGPLNEQLFLHLPGYTLLREPFSKLGPVLVVVVALLVALLVDHLLAHPPTARVPRLGLAVGGAAAAMAVLAVGFPMWTGQVVATDRPLYPDARVTVPTWWWDAAAAVNADPAPGGLLTLPLNDFYQVPTTWGYYGVDHTQSLVSRPVLQRLPGGYFAEQDGYGAHLEAVEQAIVQGDADATARLLDSLGASLVLVRGDLATDPEGGAPRSFLDPADVAAALEHVPGLTEAGRYGPLVLYRRTAPVDRVQSFGSALRTDGDATAIAAVAASTSADVAVVGPEAELPASLDAGRAAVLSTPADGDATDVPAGAAVAVRPKAPGVARVTLEGGDVVLRDAWTLGAAAPAVLGVVAGAADGARAVAVGDQAVAVAAPDPVLRIDHAADAVVLAATDAQPTVGPGGVLAGCADDSCVWRRLDSVPAGGWLEVEVTVRPDLGDTTVCLVGLADGACNPVAVVPQGTGAVEVHEVVPVPEPAGPLALTLSVTDPVRPVEPALAVTRSGRVAVTHLDAAATGRVDPSVRRPAAPLPPGRAAVAGPARQPVLGPWSQVGDCNRYDELTPGEAGLAVEVDGRDVVLAADRHSACASAPIGPLRETSSIEVSLRYERLDGEAPARLCLWHDADRRCLWLRPTDGGVAIDGRGLPTADGRVDELRVTADIPPGTDGLRLYLYADGAARGASTDTTAIAFRDIAVHAVAPLSFVVAPAAALGDPSEAASLPASWSGPAAWSAVVPGRGPDGSDPSLIASHESAAPGWRLRSTEAEGTAITVNGFRSGWVVTPTGSSGAPTVHVRYEPAFWARWALWFSVLSIAAIAGGLAWGRWGRTRRRR